MYYHTDYFIAQIINLFKKIQRELGLTYLFVAHDLAVVRHISDNIGVMYLGHLVEVTRSSDLYANPIHPYTQALLSAVPITDYYEEQKRSRILLQGEVPSPMNVPEGCPFYPRCAYATDKCRKEIPVLQNAGDNHLVACHHALLVCELAETDIYRIIVKVMKQVLVPLAVTAVVYLYLGRDWGNMAASAESARIFSSAFRLGGVTLIPAVIIILFSAFRVRVEFTMLVSIVAACGICIFYQGMGVRELAVTLLAGYRAKDAGLGALIDGGGLYSMVDIGAIVAISSAYFGIFSSTRLLSSLKGWVRHLAGRSNVFFATTVVSVIICAISCNQTLASMLTCEMTKTLVDDREQLAVNLDTSVIIIAGLIPWSIACAFPLSVVGAPKRSLLYAVYLYLVPLWMLVRSVGRRKG